jgi:hypothetical protein
LGDLTGEFTSHLQLKACSDPMANPMGSDASFGTCRQVFSLRSPTTRGDSFTLSERWHDSGEEKSDGRCLLGSPSPGVGILTSTSFHTPTRSILIIHESGTNGSGHSDL